MACLRRQLSDRRSGGVGRCPLLRSPVMADTATSNQVTRKCARAAVEQERAAAAQLDVLRCGAVASAVRAVVGAGVGFWYLLAV